MTSFEKPLEAIRPQKKSFGIYSKNAHLYVDVQTMVKLVYTRVLLTHDISNVLNFFQLHFVISGSTLQTMHKFHSSELRECLY